MNVIKRDLSVNDVNSSFYEHWVSEIVPKLKASLGDRNIMSLPKLNSITVHIRINSKNSRDKMVLQSVEKDLTMLSGQKSIFTLAKKAVSNFKTREGQIVGAKVTLRKQRMKSFLFVLRDVVIPNMRDFRGLSKKMAKSGGYNMTIFNHDVFPGVDVNNINNNFKVYINFSMKNVRNEDESLVLMQAYNMPFLKKRGA